MMSMTVRSRRIDPRLSETAKRRTEQAASVEGKAVSDLIVSSAPENAEKTVRRHECCRPQCNTHFRLGRLRLCRAEVEPAGLQGKVSGSSLPPCQALPGATGTNGPDRLVHAVRPG